MIQQNLIINLDHNQKKVRTKRGTYENAYALQGRELILNSFEGGTFPIKSIQGKELKVLTPKQIHQKLPIALTQKRASITSQSLLNDQTNHILFVQAREVTRKVHNNIMNSIKI